MTETVHVASLPTVLEQEAHFSTAKNEVDAITPASAPKVAMHLEDGPPVAALKGNGLVKSRFDDRGVWETLWIFRKAVFYCFIVFTSGIMESFELSMAGSIIANRGFINQFGKTQADGTYALDTSYGKSRQRPTLIHRVVSAWGAIIVGQFQSSTQNPVDSCSECWSNCCRMPCPMVRHVI